ncbi:MAG: hypothetical protein AAFR51_03460 [Pseudomonadota bacterium]
MLSRLLAHWRLLTIAAILSAALLALHAVSGTPAGASYILNLPWFNAFNNAFWAGDLYPRFSFDFWYGLGGLDFYFYAPLPFWFSSTVGQVTCPGCAPHTTFAVSGAWMVIFAGISFFVFARRFFSVPWAGFGGLLYAVLPYHYINDWYWRQSIGEVLAAAIIPLLALSIIRLSADKKGGAMFAICLAALALAHLPSFLIGCHLFALIILWKIFQRQSDWRARGVEFARFAGWGLLGVSLCALYWIPALGLLDTVSPEILFSEFANPADWLFLDGRPEPDPFTSLVAKVCLGLVIVAAWCAYRILRRSNANRDLQVWIFAPSLFAFLMLTPLAYPIWEYWILSTVQFPFRPLVFADLSVGLAAIVIAKNVVQASDSTIRRSGAVLSAFAITALSVAYLAQAPKVLEMVSDAKAFNGAFERAGGPEFIPPRMTDRAREVLNETAQPGMTSNQRYAIFFKAMEQNLLDAEATLVADAPGAVWDKAGPDQVTLSVDLDTAATVRVPIAAWPYWRAKTASGDVLAVSEDADLGLLSVALPRGASTVTFYRIETQYERAGRWLSTLGALILLIYLGWTWRRRKHELA